MKIDTKTIDAIAIGGFDGMHKGHQKLFGKLGKNGCVVVIESGYANLTPNGYRQKYVDYPILYLKLQDIKHLSGAEFIEFLKNKFPNLKKIVVGYDFHFAKNRQCSHHDLKRFFSGEVVVVDEVSMHGDSVHSHKIRAKLAIGDIKGANEFLGHNYMIHAKVICGQGLGSKKLVPTLNLHVEDFLLPKDGVYATLSSIDNDKTYHPSITFIGHRHSTDGCFAVETHIFDLDIACRDVVSVSFVDFVRENKKFNSLDDLKQQIAFDISLAKQKIEMLNL